MGAAMDKATAQQIQAIADCLAAETLARAAIFQAQGKLKGKSIDRIEAINAALLAMLLERQPQ